MLSNSLDFGEKYRGLFWKASVITCLFFSACGKGAGAGESAPDASTPKKATAAFMAAMLSGESVTVHALGVGTNDQFKIVDDVGTLGAAMKRFDAAARNRFGDQATPPMFKMPDIAMDDAEEKIDGDKATLTGKGSPQTSTGTLLKKEGNIWKIDISSIASDKDIINLARANASAGPGIDAITANVEAGKFPNYPSAQKAVGLVALAATLSNQVNPDAENGGQNRQQGDAAAANNLPGAESNNPPAKARVPIRPEDDPAYILVKAIQDRDFPTILNANQTYWIELNSIRRNNPKVLWAKLQADLFERLKSDYLATGLAFGDLPELLSHHCRFKVIESRSGGSNNSSAEMLRKYVQLDYDVVDDAPVAKAGFLQQAIVLIPMDVLVKDPESPDGPAFLVENQLAPSRVETGDVTFKTTSPHILLTTINGSGPKTALHVTTRGGRGPFHLRFILQKHLRGEIDVPGVLDNEEVPFDTTLYGWEMLGEASLLLSDADGKTDSQRFTIREQNGYTDRQVSVGPAIYGRTTEFYPVHDWKDVKKLLPLNQDEVQTLEHGLKSEASLIEEQRRSMRRTIKDGVLVAEFLAYPGFWSEIIPVPRPYATGQLNVQDPAVSLSAGTTYTNQVTTGQLNVQDPASIRVLNSGEIINFGQRIISEGSSLQFTATGAKPVHVAIRLSSRQLTKRELATPFASKTWPIPPQNLSDDQLHQKSALTSFLVANSTLSGAAISKLGTSDNIQMQLRWSEGDEFGTGWITHGAATPRRMQARIYFDKGSPIVEMLDKSPDPTIGDSFIFRGHLDSDAPTTSLTGDWSFFGFRSQDGSLTLAAPSTK